MRRILLLAGVLLLAAPASAQESSNTPTTVKNAAGEDVVQLMAPDGRLQLMDASGDPVFDAAGGPVFPPTPDEGAQQAFEESVALRNGALGQPDLAGAAAKLRTATELKPDLAPAWYDLGLVLLDQNLVDDAEAALKKASDLDAGNPSVWLALGISYERNGMLTAADTAFATGLGHAPQDVPLLNGVARLLRKRGQFRAAADKSKAVLQVNSNSLDAYNTLGLSYLGLGQYELARFVFMKAAASVPGGDSSASIASNLGLVFFREGKAFEAEARFQAAHDLDPNHPGAMVNLAQVKLRNLDYLGGLELLERAHQILPASIPIQLDLAVARRGTGDLSGAQKLLEEIANGQSTYAEKALLNLGILEGDFLKDYGAAIDTYNEYVALRESGGHPVSEDDPVHGYLKEVTKLKKKEDRRKAKAAKKAAKAAQEAAEAPQDAPAVDSGAGADPAAPAADGASTDGGAQ